MSRDWITTYSGLKVYPLKMESKDIHIDDIAHALSNKCRFGGHGNFYSVAQHSVLVSQTVSGENALYGLLHDASEAYLGDILKPIKSSVYFSINDRFVSYEKVEEDLMKIIIQKYGQSFPMPKEVKEIDTRLLITEAKSLGLYTSEWKDIFSEKPLDIEICPLDPEQSKILFLNRFEEVLVYNFLKSKKVSDFSF